MSDTPNNLVIGLSDEIARVSAKAQRYRNADAANGMKIGLFVMEAAIERGRQALATGDVLEMMPAYRALKGYSDDD